MRKSSLLWDTEGKRDRLYGRRWRDARAVFIAAHPLCTMCEKAGKLVAATVVDHVVPHKGDEAVFWDRANWQALCQHHHNSEKARLEIRGYSDRLGEDGWPLDPSHPAVSGVEIVCGKGKPDGLKRLRVEAVIVCGPPGAGKSWHVAENAGPNDTVIDFDLIDAQINGRARQRGRLIVPILRERNARIIAAARQTIGRVWLPMTLPKATDRQWWRQALGNVSTVVIEAPADLCKRRIVNDRARASQAEDECEAVDRWWSVYRPSPSDRVIIPRGGVEDEAFSLDTASL